MKIPLPHNEVFNQTEAVFAPAPELVDFVQETFFNAKSELHNPDHQPIAHASLGFLWTNVENITKGRRVLAMVEKGEPNGKPWQKYKKEAQILGWFGTVPMFIITIDARYYATANDVQRCALIEHELYHIRQKKDEYGLPKFNKETGLPVLGIVGHDVEEFVGVVERYGAVSEELHRMKRALNNAPTMDAGVVQGVCGTCLTRVA